MDDNLIVAIRCAHFTNVALHRAKMNDTYDVKIINNNNPIIAKAKIIYN